MSSCILKQWINTYKYVYIYIYTQSQPTTKSSYKLALSQVEPKRILYSLTNSLACLPTPANMKKSVSGVATVPGIEMYINFETNSVVIHPHSTEHKSEQLTLILRVYIMNNKVRDIPSETVSKSLFRSRKPIPRRGQIKSRIAANAFHSIVSAISRASSNRKHPRRLTYLREH
ncbi:hypothetical protein ACOSQ3_025008 [Xanthoceras sorbifolium]